MYIFFPLIRICTCVLIDSGLLCNAMDLDVGLDLFSIASQDFPINLSNSSSKDHATAC